MMEPEHLGSVHFWVGCIAITAGFTAFATRKGQTVHRSAGTIFVFTMLGLTLSGLWLSIAREILFTVFLSAIAFHALVTGWAAARVQTMLGRALTTFAPLLSAALTVGSVYGGHMARSAPSQSLNGLPPTAFDLIAGVSSVIILLDLLFIRAHRPSERQRLTRHLWRMGFSFFLATGIFFFGNNNVLPEVLRTPVALSAPVLSVVVWTVLYAVKTRFASGS